MNPNALPPQVMCGNCLQHTTIGLKPSEAAEVVRCLHFDELRNRGWVRRCSAFQPIPPRTVVAIIPA